MKPKLEDVLFLDIKCEHTHKYDNQVFSKKECNLYDFKCPDIKINEENLKNLMKEELKQKYYPGFIKYFKVDSKDCILKVAKNSQKSTEARIRGNELFARNQHNADIHEEVWKLYSKSIALAPTGSKELVLAYECRSNLLFHLKKYEDSIKDIDRALALTDFDLLKVKILCRKITCFTAMNKDVVEKEALWTSLVLHLKKIDHRFRDEKFRKMVREAHSYVGVSNMNKIGNRHEDSISVSFLSNIKLTQNEDKHFIADRDYVAGEIVTVRKPTIVCVNPDNFYAHCSHCLAYMWAGIPCDECSLCMYCSEECKKEAWEKYHILECKVLPYIDFDYFIYFNFATTIKMFMMGVREFGSIPKLLDKVREIEQLKSDPNFVRNNKTFDSEFLNFYSLPNVQRADICIMSHVVKNTSFLMAYLTQISEDIFEKKVGSMTGKELSKDNDFVLCGVVMLQIMMLTELYSDYPYGAKPEKSLNSKKGCLPKRCCTVANVVYDLNGHIKKSCNPSLAICQTHDGKTIYFCVQPIKEMEMFTVAEITPFYNHDKFVRHQMKADILRTHACGCTACVKEWPPVLEDSKKYEKKFARRSSKVQTKGTEIVEDYLRKAEAFKDVGLNKEQFQKHLQELARDTNIVVSTCGQPSFQSSWMINTLSQSFVTFHGRMPRVPNNCLEASKK